MERRVEERTAELARLTDVLEATTDFVGISDADGNVLYINPAGRRMVGLRDDEPIDDFVIADFTAESQKDRVFGIIIPSVFERGIWTGEVALAHRDGHEIPVSSVIVANRDAAGEVSALATISRDITSVLKAQRERDELHRRLLESALLAGKAEIATSVLHNVGNVLNSVNVSANLLMEKLQKSRVVSLAKASEVISQHQDDLPAFLTEDERGRHFPRLLAELAANLCDERDMQVEELRSLVNDIEHVKEIINMQQTYAQVRGTTEPVNLIELVEDALKMNDGGLLRHSVTVLREFDEVPPIVSVKHKLLQILVNLISNAKYALSDCDRDDKTMTLTVAADEDSVCVRVRDNGVGIPQENFAKIFSHGFTTRKDGHGFGLHSAALAAQELAGSLSAHSDGSGTGATFTLRLPIEQEVICKI